MKIGLDVDGTIGAAPAFYCFLARSWRAAGGEVHVVTSRDEIARRSTERYLERIGLEYDHLVFTWDKHEYAAEVGLSALFDDLEPFLHALPEDVVGLHHHAAPSPADREAGLNTIEEWRQDREGGGAST